jgi:DNA-binding transcriptional LysR family regulator
MRGQPASIVERGDGSTDRASGGADRLLPGAPETVPRSAVGAPEYFARQPASTHPRDVAAHECLNWRPGSDQAPYAWEFTEDGHDFAVAFEARVLTNDPALDLRLALAGVGLALAREDVVRPYIERGELVSMLEEFSTPFPGFYLFYPARRQASPALRALIDCLLELRQAR